jgi:uncharacterized protein YqjF (DUF2071 family)
MHQSWHDLLFMHWALPAEVVAGKLPAGLTLDTYEGAAYVGVVPFSMRNVRPRYVPAVPWLSFFPELNVRTYVYRDERPGVYFFSLDAANPVAVGLARTFFHLPYFNAVMHSETVGEGLFGPTVRYRSTRADRRAPPAELQVEYAPTGASRVALPGSLEYFLTARYCLYATDRRGAVIRGEIDHPPWQLQPASAATARNTMINSIAPDEERQPPHLLFVKALDVLVWLPRPVASVL